MRSRIHVRVDTIVLRGFAARERHVVAHSLRRELARLLGAVAPPAKSRSLNTIDGGTLHVSRGDAATAVGREAARRIARSVRP